MRARTRSLSVLTLLGALIAGCEKNPIDAALEEALDFSGAFEAEDGTIIEMDGSSEAYIRRVGSTQLSFGSLEVGEKYIVGAYPDETVEGRWRGYVRRSDGFLVWGTISFDGERMTITPDEGSAPAGQIRWNRTTYVGDGGGGSGSGGSGTGNGGGTAGSKVLLYQKDLQGDEKSSRYFSVTVPAGTKKLTVEMFEENEWGRNLGDLFVSQGTKPTASHYPYVWSAQCASVESNRAREVCSFASPKAGTWHILVYGYHGYYGTSLKVTIDS